jgi:hypothetical protein
MKELSSMRILVLNNTAVSKHVGCVSVMEFIEKTLMSLSQDFEVVYLPVSLDWDLLKNWIAKQNFDTLIVNGEGSIHNTAIRSYARTLLKSAELDIPGRYIVNASFENLDLDYDKHLLRRFTGILARDTFSASLVSDYNPNVTVSCDFSLLGYDDMQLKNYMKRSKSGILIQDSVEACVSANLKSLSKRLQSNYYVFEKPIVGYRGRMVRKIKRSISKSLPLSNIKYTPCSYEALHCFKTYIEKFDSIITGRYHGVMHGLAVGAEINFVPSNTKKIQNALDDIGLTYSKSHAYKLQNYDVFRVEGSNQKLTNHIIKMRKNASKFFEKIY